ncbi:putative homeobox transcription factor [Talaromyces proteolyticus]|uniref:Homeobox transcription factor n=1 Tax=Talaromyces proteolyticus TaxID=1131652 RepID=A0AAD4L5V7_9EURO|nr:putative homeobox transcription factor [Talaromyces proteolyticus]KAH8704127.1 putative homeobox transcription factor [Talaromyces proteolyticus]
MSSTDTPAAPAASTSATASATSANSTPSPSTTSPTTSAQNSRRPQRKSTLTQQQKNQKRQRATQDQLVTLELEFNKNPTPTAAVRERIAHEINMTERSVQIWFQNRRAKIKMIAKKSIETGEDCDSIPDSMRQYLAMQFDLNKPGARDLFGRASGLSGYPNNGFVGDAGPSGKVMIHHFTCRSLSVGSWRRIGQNAMDLVIFYSPDKATMTYYINNDSAGYKIEYPFSYIKNITLESGDSPQNANGAPSRPGGLLVELMRPPMFYMDSSNSGGFYQCGDFTEDQQASRVMVHHLGGHPKVLSVQLAKLVSLESFQNRLNFNYAVSAPVTPPQDIHRPASQPNQFPLAQLGMFAEPHLSVNHMPRGHKRQRSRSVPPQVDLSYLHTPMPAYQIQQSVSHLTPNSTIFAPMPQHNSIQGLSNNLRIDTAATYSVDPRPYPMSATASDYASPPFFSTAPPSEAISMGASAGNQFSLPYVSPSPMVDQSKLMDQQPSSMPNVTHADPYIADHSPPLSMHTTGSGEMFSFGGNQQQGVSEDGLLLSEMYAKHNLNNFAMDSSKFDFSMHGMSEPQTHNIAGDLAGIQPYEMIDPTSS